MNETNQEDLSHLEEELERLKASVNTIQEQLASGQSRLTQLESFHKQSLEKQDQMRAIEEKIETMEGEQARIRENNTLLKNKLLKLQKIAEDVNEQRRTLESQTARKEGF